MPTTKRPRDRLARTFIDQLKNDTRIRKEMSKVKNERNGCSQICSFEDNQIYMLDTLIIVEVTIGLTCSNSEIRIGELSFSFSFFIKA